MNPKPSSPHTTHCVAGWRGKDPKQAGDTPANARQHPLALLQGSTLQLSCRIRTHSQQLILDRRQDKAVALKETTDKKRKEHQKTTGLRMSIQTNKT